MDKQLAMQIIYELASSRENFQCVDVMRQYRAKTCQMVDWHEFSYLLDEMATGNKINRVGTDPYGRALYAW